MGTLAAPGPLQGLNQGSSPNSGPDARSHQKSPQAQGWGPKVPTRRPCILKRAPRWW